MVRNIVFSFLILSLILGICCMLGLHVILLFHQQPKDNLILERERDVDHFADVNDLVGGDSLMLEDLHMNDELSHRKSKAHLSASKSYVRKDCQMGSCFDYSRCKKSFKVFVYPDIQGDYQSVTFQEILKVIRNSVYFTNNPREACIFIPSFDTLDRDVNSVNFRREISDQISGLQFWNKSGRNHVIFNLYAGTSPDYHEEEYYFKVSESILAKASFSTTNFRQNFDISLPLMHKGYPSHSDRPVLINNMLNRVKNKYTLAFKGKRYLIGIGSRSRNALYHVHNHKDIILLTTCRHNNDWMKYMDDRCLIDNRLYDQYDYQELLNNSTFCLVPRGRRLGSYRFVEVLRAGCIPVILSNDYEPPFSEVIDWRRAVIWIDERLLFQIPWVIRSVSEKRIVAYRQQVKFLYDTYFSSLDKIINTVIEILRDRLSIHSRDKFIWNNYPGALSLQSGYSSLLCDFPLTLSSCRTRADNRATAIIFCGISMNCSEDLISQTISELKWSNLIKHIILIWQNSRDRFVRLQDILKRSSLPSDYITMVHDESQSSNNRFSHLNHITTQSIITINCFIRVTQLQIKELYGSWMKFPDRIIGFIGKSHEWNSVELQWRVLDEVKTDYSMVLLDLAIYHKYYHWSYWQVFSSQTRKLVDKSPSSQCASILFNLLVSHLVHKAPILIKQTNDNKVHYHSPVDQDDLTAIHQTCLNEFAVSLGYLPLEKALFFLKT